MKSEGGKLLASALFRRTPQKRGVPREGGRNSTPIGEGHNELEISDSGRHGDRLLFMPDQSASPSAQGRHRGSHTPAVRFSEARGRRSRGSARRNNLPATASLPYRQPRHGHAAALD